MPWFAVASCSAGGAHVLHPVHALDRPRGILAELEADGPLARGDEVQGRVVRSELGSRLEAVPDLRAVAVHGEDAPLPALDRRAALLVTHDHPVQHSLARARRERLGGDAEGEAV